MANKNFTVKNGLEVGGQEVISSSGAITSAALGGQTLGTTDSPTFANATLTGSLRGPSTFTIDPAAVGDNTGTLVIAGNLQVDGTTTTINSTTMTVDDLNLTLASGAANAAAANGAGITVDIAGTTNPSLVYGSSNDDWTFNKDINVTGTVTSDNAVFGTTSDAQTIVYITSSTTGESELRLGDTDTDAGSISYTNSNDTLTFRAAAANRMSLNSTGLDVTGTVTATSLSAVSATFEGAAVNINLLETNTTDVNTRFRLNSGDFIIQTLNDAQDAVTSRLAVDNATGDISFYEDTGATAKFFWDASAERLGIGTTSPSETLHVSSRSRIQNLYLGEVASNFDVVQATSSAGLYLTGGGSNGIYLDSSANVGIGTSSPSRKLHIGGTAPGDSIIRQDATSSGTNWEIGERVAGKYQFWEDDGDNVRLTIMSTGNVGIGTDSPSDRLVVQKDTTGIEPILVLKNDNTTNDNGVSIDFAGKDTDGNNITYGRIATKYTNHSTEKSHMIFSHRNNSGTFSEWMRVNHDGQFLIPSGNLYLTGSNDRRIKLSDSGIAGNSDSNNTVHIRGDNDYMKLSAAGNGGFIFEENGSERFRINPTGSSKLRDTGIEVYNDIYSNSGSDRGGGYFRFLTDGAGGAEQSVAQIYMEQGSGDGAARKCNMYFQVSDNGSPTTAVTIENNKNMTLASSLLYLNGSSTYSVTSATTGAVLRGAAVQHIRVHDHRTPKQNSAPHGHMSFGFTSYALNNTSPWADILYLQSYTDASGGSPNALVVSRSGSNAKLVRYSWSATSTAAISGGTSYGLDSASASDERLKENVNNITNGLTVINQLRPVTFNWNDTYIESGSSKNAEELKVESDTDQSIKMPSSKVENVGLIAQEVEAVVPTVVHEGQISIGGVDYKNVDYKKLVPHLIAALQEADAKIDALTTRIEVLEG